MNSINDWFTNKETEVIETASYIFNHPEIAFEETDSSKCLARFLEKEGFAITWNIGDMETAFLATWGKGSPIIGFLAEYDALPGLSQAPVPYLAPQADAGHGCGHNLLGTAVAAAACALKASLIESKQDATIRVYGCPAEEILQGKVILAEQHFFDDLDVAVTWHPFDENRVSNDIWLAQDIKNYTFHGITSHAAKNPEQGRSALDSVELMNVGTNYLREHVTDDIRLHYGYVGQGQPANVVPDYAKVNYFIRSGSHIRLRDVSKRVDDCAKGAALMSGTEVNIELVSYCKEMKVNQCLCEIYQKTMTEIPTPEYTKEELDFASSISTAAGFPKQHTWFRGVEPMKPPGTLLFVGTDVATVSHIVPTITIFAATMCKGTPFHHWSTTAQSGMSIGYKGMIYAAKCLAKGTRELIDSPSLLKEAWEEHKK